MNKASEFNPSASVEQAGEPPEHGLSGLDRSYLPELDGLRFFAFLLVFGFHDGLPDLGGLIRDLFAMTVDLPVLLVFGLGGLGGPLGRFIDHVFQANGWIGVNLFFTLSGFIITRLLLDEELKFGKISWRAFWMRRILRIWPLFYLIFLIGFVGVPGVAVLRSHAVGLSSIHAPWFGLFLGNWSMIRFGPVGSDIVSVLWSVCVEEQFYLFIPIVLSMTGKRGRIAFCLVGITAAVLRRWSLARLNVPQYQMTYDSLAQMDGILAGVLLAVLVQSAKVRAQLHRWSKTWHVWVLGLATLILISRHHLGHDVPVRRVVDPLVISLFSTAWVLYAALGARLLARVLACRPVVMLGKVSYGLYLWHEVILTTYGRDFFSLFLVILTAIGSYYLFERPILLLKKRWSRVQSRPV